MNTTFSSAAPVPSPSARHAVWRSVASATAVMFVVISAFESTKQLVFPRVTIWQSHALTIAFTTVVASLIATVVAGRLMTMNRALRESEQRYALAARGSHDGLWDWNLVTDELFLSSRWKAIIGYEDLEVGSRPGEWFDRVHPADLPGLRADFDAHLAGRTAHFQHEHRMRHKNGAFRWVLARGLAVRNATGAAVRIAGSQADITEGKVVDALTGLPNRMLLLDRLGRLMEQQRRTGDGFAVLYLDLDGFKLINDGLGHQAGDELLRTIADRIERCLRTSDTLARAASATPHPADAHAHTLGRIGGDEFIVLLHSIGAVGDSMRVADRIHEALALPFKARNVEVFATCSIGIVESDGRYSRPDEMVRDADTAMYRAKSLGKGCSEVFDVEMRMQLLKRWQLDADLRRALQRNEFQPCFQPIIDVRTGRVAGFEALMRWHHPMRGIVMPGEFVPLLEETGLILSVGNRFFNEVCAQFAPWKDREAGLEPLHISVNFASQQLLEPNVVDRLLRSLDAQRLRPGHLIIEITESTAIKDLTLTGVVLRDLQQAGIRVVLDDFGTGYSSLACLHQLPISGIKLDRSFLHRGADHPQILEAIVALAHSLTLTVTAEGVETSQQHAHVRSLGCEFAQGYYLSAPLDIRHTEAVDALMALLDAS